jgi:hypothetical protein
VVGFARARLDGEVLVAEVDGELVGVAAGAVFAGTGWVGGVAVVPAHRRVGLGGALTEAIVAFLEDRGVATVLLHATALGRPVYERLGFVPETAYLTLTGPTLPRSARGPRVRPGRAADLEAVVALDGAATGEDRRRLLSALCQRPGPAGRGPGRPRRRGLAVGAGRQRHRRRVPGGGRLRRALPHGPDAPGPPGRLGPGRPVRRPQPVLGLTPEDGPGPLEQGHAILSC